MPKFLNKNELVLLALTILLFDVSGFCYVAYPYAVNGQGSLFTIIIMMFLLAYSVYVFHVICNSYPTFSISYEPIDVDLHGESASSCINILENLKRSKEHDIREMEKICLEKPIDRATYLTEKVMLTMIAIIFLLFVFVCIFKVDNEDDNTWESRILRAIPMMVIALGLLVFANIYLPFMSDIQYSQDASHDILQNALQNSSQEISHD